MCPYFKNLCLDCYKTVFGTYSSLPVYVCVCVFCSGEWYCTFCRDLNSPEMEYDIDGGGESKNVKPDPDSVTFTPEDRRVCYYLLNDMDCVGFTQS